MDHEKKFHELAADFDTVVLVTAAQDGTLHARPMQLARLEESGRAYFSTALDSAKITELKSDPHAVATFQGAKQFATLSGTVSLSRDRGLIAELWQDDWAVWFPNGKDDPQLCILILDGKIGEYWDRSGIQEMAYRLAEIGAAVTGESPVEPREQYGKVTF